MASTVSPILSVWTIKRQEYISCFCCIGMLAGFLFSRGLLSVSMICMFVNALHPRRLAATWNDFKHNAFAIASLVFFLVYAISGIWSEDKGNWWAIMQIKLPFVFLPFALLNAPLQQIKYRKIVLYASLFILLAGMLYSFQTLVFDSNYLKSQAHLPSPVQGDYIRFTIALVLGLQFVAYFFIERRILQIGTIAVAGLVAWGVLAVLYIHIQAAKSGLLCFYIVAALYLFSVLLKQKKRFVFIALGAMALMAVAGFLFVPSFNRQVQNISYEQKVWETNDTAKFSETSSFVPRLVSYKISLGIIGANPLLGAGAGDLKAKMDKVYLSQYPVIVQQARLLPHNQFICTAAMVGLPLGLSLVLLVCSTLYRSRIRVYTIATLMVMVVGLMIEPMLETQYGIFTYLFFTLFWVSIFKRGRVVAS